MQSIVRPVAIIAATILLAACDTNPVQPAPADAALQSASFSSDNGTERWVEESLYDLTDSYAQVVCEDGTESELIALEGQIYERWSAFFTPSGSIHAKLQTMPIGMRGFSTVSGEEYRAKEQNHSTVNQTSMGITGTYRSKISFVGVESKRTFEMTLKGHYTLNANGEWVVERETETAVCR